VARELSLKGKKALMLEKGGMPEKIKGSGLQTLPTMKMRPTTDKSVLCWQEVVGGATFSFCGCALDPPYELFERHGVNIREEVKETKEEIPIEPLSDYLLGPMASRIMEAAHDAGYEWHKLPKFIDQKNCRPGCHRCWYSCPWGAKWSARHFVDEALENRGEIIAKARVDKVLVDYHNKAEGVQYTKKGKTHVAYAPIVVVAAGGIGTPLLLRRSGITDAGHNFFFDPLTMVVGNAKGLKSGAAEVPMATGFENEEDGYLITDLTTPASLYASMALSKFKFKDVFSSRNALCIMVKVRDSLSGSVTEKGKIVKVIGDKEKRAFRAGCERAEKILKKAGVKNTYITDIAGAHPGGTAKIDDIVDTNLQTKYENLYVCDASVIPEEFGFPPVLTLIALGKRLAKHLTAEK
jgi:choline dehydrogenase-like flavoprotein